jgi:glucose dehydrogenase
MPSPLRSKPVLKITGVLAGGRGWLAALGGSTFYVALGLGILASGYFWRQGVGWPCGFTQPC